MDRATSFQRIYFGKRVLVTGHTGFKGSWLCEWLLKLGAKVCGYSIDVPTNPSHFETLNLSEKITHHVGDILDSPALDRVFREFSPEIVFHLAARPIVLDSYEDPKLTFTTNLVGTINVLEAIRQCAATGAAVFITSDKCYENVEWEFGYRETDRLGGKDPYSASKACAEIAVSSYARSFFASGHSSLIATARAGNVIGGGDWARHRIIPDCARAWARGEAALIRNPDSTRPWQHVLEPLSGYLWLGAQLFQKTVALSGEAFNFGPLATVSPSVETVISEMKKHWPAAKWRSEASATPLRPEAGLLRLNCDKALARLGWEPTLRFDENIEMTAHWYRSFYADKNLVLSLTSDQIHHYESLARERHKIWG